MLGYLGSPYLGKLPYIRNYGYYGYYGGYFEFLYLYDPKHLIPWELCYQSITRCLISTLNPKPWEECRGPVTDMKVPETTGGQSHGIRV